MAGSLFEDGGTAFNMEGSYGYIGKKKKKRNRGQPSSDSPPAWCLGEVPTTHYYKTDIVTKQFYFINIKYNALKFATEILTSFHDLHMQLRAFHLTDAPTGCQN